MFPDKMYFGDLEISVKMEDSIGLSSTLSMANDTNNEITIQASLSDEAKKSALFVRIMDFAYWHTCEPYISNRKYLLSSLLYAVLRDNPALLDILNPPYELPIRILGRNFSTIHFPEHEPFKGSVLSGSLEIRMRLTDNARDYKQTLIHEIVHNILNVIEWPEDDEDNEAETDRLSRSLMFIIGQNDMSWMKETRDEQIEIRDSAGAGG